MTTEDRVIVLRALWLAVRHTRALSPAHARRVMGDFQAAIACLYNAHGDTRATEAYEQGRRDAEQANTAARDDAYRAGMLAVQRRADYRDPFETHDPEELRRIH